MSKKIHASERRPDLTFNVDRVFVFETSNTLDTKAQLGRPSKAPKKKKHRPRAK